MKPREKQARGGKDWESFNGRRPLPLAIMHGSRSRESEPQCKAEARGRYGAAQRGALLVHPQKAPNSHCPKVLVPAYALGTRWATATKEVIGSDSFSQVARLKGTPTPSYNHPRPLVLATPGGRRWDPLCTVIPGECGSFQISGVDGQHGFGRRCSTFRTDE
jgi:hypothetical protein